MDSEKYLDYLEYLDLECHGLEEMIEALRYVAYSSRFVHRSAPAGEWLCEMNRIIENDQRVEQIDSVTTIACEVLSSIDGAKRITAPYLFEQLRTAIWDSDANSTVKFDPYSYVDISIITCIIFDSFDGCSSRMGDDEFEYNY